MSERLSMAESEEELVAAVAAIAAAAGFDLGRRYALDDEMRREIRAIEDMEPGANLTAAQGNALLENPRLVLVRTASVPGAAASMSAQSVRSRWQFLRATSPVAADTTWPCFASSTYPCQTVCMGQMTVTATRVELDAEAALVRFLGWDRTRRAAAFAIWGTPSPAGHFVVGPALVHSRDSVTFLLWDSADPPGARFPYRAILVRRSHGLWAIRTIQSQCTACFGTALVEAESLLCDSCQGEGWGVSSGRKRSVLVAA